MVTRPDVPRRCRVTRELCDVATINVPLHAETQGLFNDALMGKLKRCLSLEYARGKICDRHAVVRAFESGQLAGYAGDVWYPQPAPKDHPWRTMPHHGMTPHVRDPVYRLRRATQPERAKLANAG
ncbi:MAG: NAD(P)-dependent oxidoreductase [Candidatus Cybelea sp.]